jgi:hypothetical protein
MKISSSVKEIAKRIAYRHTRLGAPSYPFGIEPILLSCILQHMEKIQDSTVSIVEAGVARGMTTRFLLEHMRISELKNKYFAIDTFSGFVESQIVHEQEHRGKDASSMRLFQYNDFEIWKRNFVDFKQLIAVQADISSFDFSTVKPIEVFVLDVDLYIPTIAALRNVWDHMSQSGVIYLDDIAPNNNWDGSLQAFEEFVKETGARSKRVGKKSGMIFRN